MRNSIYLLFTAFCFLLATPLWADTVHPFSPYVDTTLNVHWDSQYNDLEPLDLTQISNGVTSYHLAFITDAGSCNPSWGGQSTYSVNNPTPWGKHLTDKMQTKNLKYIISFGGASGTDLSANCSTTQLQNVLQKVITSYNPEGLDFDIENGTAQVPKLMTALKAIQSDAKNKNLRISFTLPTMPEGLVAAGKDVLTQATAAGLDYSVNIMAMDYGSSYNGNMGEYAIYAATNLFAVLKQLYPNSDDKLLWAKIEITPMIGVNDVNVELFKLEDVDSVRRFAKAKGLGQLEMWDASRDHACPDLYARTDCSGANLQTHDYEYAQRFAMTN